MWGKGWSKRGRAARICCSIRGGRRRLCSELGLSAKVFRLSALGGGVFECATEARWGGIGWLEVDVIILLLRKLHQE